MYKNYTLMKIYTIEKMDNTQVTIGTEAGAKG